MMIDIHSTSSDSSINSVVFLVTNYLNYPNIKVQYNIPEPAHGMAHLNFIIIRLHED